MKAHLALAVVFLMVLVTIPASASTYWCTGTVTNLNTYSDGTITLSVPGQSPQIYLCNLTSNFGNWTPNGCKAAYALLLSAKLSGLQVEMGFNDTFTCSNPEVGAQGTGAYSVTILP